MHGYTWSDKPFKEIQPYYFNSLIDSRKQFFSITIRNKNNSKIEIRDSQKKFLHPLVKSPNLGSYQY